MPRRAKVNTTLTFLFTDIEGSTREWERSPGMHERVEQHFVALRAAVGEGGGEVFATMGDGIAAAFTSAEAAVHVAIAAQHRLAPIGLSVRMGLHTGEAERVGHDYRGRPLNRAARIMSMAHGGQILVSDVAAALLRTGPNPVDLVDLGTQQLRDIAEPERVWQVLHPDLDARFPPVSGPDRSSNNLPLPRSSLVGRTHEVARVIGLLRQHRIVTLTGVGGVGKTRLAVQAATDLRTEFRHVWFVELAGVADPADVADTVARTVGAPAVADPLVAATTLLAAERTLLVLDNCEHVVDSAASVADVLTAACPELSVLATSREPLDIEGEHVVAVRPLDPATSAAALFRLRAAAAGTDLDEVPRATVEHLCRRLDGIPLAVELAAARTASLGVAAIVDALDDRFSLLRDGSGRRRAIDRHGTMRATIDWSYRLLDPAEQRLLQWLAVFPSGFELDAAEHVAGALGIDARAAVDHLASLVNKSMVAAEPRSDGLRYRMLETVRAFALEQLDDGEAGQADLALTALAEWVATITDLPFTQPCDAAVERNAIRLEREADSWREAVVLAAQTGSGALAARLCGPPVAFFLLGRHDLAHFVRPLLDLCDGDVLQRRAVLCALMVSAAGATEPTQLQAWADEMQAVDEAERTGLGALMQWLALAWQGDFATSVEVCAAASLDPGLHRSTRDMLVGIATLDRFSLTDATDDPHGLVGRALEVAGRSDVAMHRVTCLLGAAWGLAESQPDFSLDLVRRALEDIGNVPALTRHTLPGGASRLLTRLDPQVAAQGLLEQLDATPSYRTFVDLIPVFYATALLHRVGHPAARSALADFTGSATAPYLSMMDSVDLARRAASSNLVSLADLAATVRSALVDIAGDAGPRADGPGRPERPAPWRWGTLAEHTSFLDRLDPRHRDGLLALGRARRHPAHSILFFEGDEAHDVVVVHSGAVKVAHTVEGHEVVLDVLTEGDVLGELSAVDGGPRSATATALTAVDVTTIPSAAFMAFLADHPDAGLTLLRCIAGRLRDASRRQVEYGALDGLGRVCRRLVELVDRYGEAPGPAGVRIAGPLTQSDIAAWAGLSREAVVRALHGLRTLGWVATTPRTITVVDVDAVTARAALG